MVFHVTAVGPGGHLPPGAPSGTLTNVTLYVDTLQMPKHSLVLILALFAVCAPYSMAYAATYYVDSANGNDNNSGTSETSAFRSVSKVSALSLAAGDSVLFRRGQTYSGVLNVGSNGSANAPISFATWGSGNPPLLYEIYISGNYVTIDGLDVDHQKDASDAIRVRSGHNATFRNMEIRNGTQDGIDADQADGLTVENVEIHHFLNGSFGSQDDSHGITATNTDGVTIRNVNIHQVSGDSFQADPNRLAGNITNNILIEDSVLWTAPLAQNFNSGWSAGDSPGENAIDTKVVTSGWDSEIRMKITLRGLAP